MSDYELSQYFPDETDETTSVFDINGEGVSQGDYKTIREAFEDNGFDTVYFREFPSIWASYGTRYQFVGVHSKTGERCYGKSIGLWEKSGYERDEVTQVRLYNSSMGETPYNDESPFKGIRPHY